MKLQIRLFGHFEVWKDAHIVDEWPRHKTQELFKLLIAERGRIFSQEQLIETLFFDLDPDKATNNLQKRTSELRCALEPALSHGKDSQFILQAKGRTLGYSFNKEVFCEIDLVQFEQEIEAAAKLEQAIEYALSTELEEAAENATPGTSAQ